MPARGRQGVTGAPVPTPANRSHNQVLGPITARQGHDQVHPCYVADQTQELITLRKVAHMTATAKMLTKNYLEASCQLIDVHLLPRRIFFGQVSDPYHGN